MHERNANSCPCTPRTKTTRTFQTSSPYCDLPLLCHTSTDFFSLPPILMLSSIRDNLRGDQYILYWMQVSQSYLTRHVMGGIPRLRQHKTQKHCPTFWIMASGGLLQKDKWVNLLASQARMAKRLNFTFGALVLVIGGDCDANRTSRVGLKNQVEPWGYTLTVLYKKLIPSMQSGGYVFGNAPRGLRQLHDTYSIDSETRLQSYKRLCHSNYYFRFLVFLARSFVGVA